MANEIRDVQAAAIFLWQQRRVCVGDSGKARWKATGFGELAATVIVPNNVRMAVVGTFLDQIQLVAGIAERHIVVGREQLPVGPINESKGISQPACKNRDRLKIWTRTENLSFPGVIENVAVAVDALGSIKAAVRSEHDAVFEC